MVIRNNVIPYTDEIRLENGFIISIDRLRLKLKVKFNFVETLMNYLTGMSDFLVDESILENKYGIPAYLNIFDKVDYHYYSKNGFNQYKNMFNFYSCKDKSQTFTFAMVYRDFSGKFDQQSAFLEFNPNKVKNPTLLYLIDYILKSCKESKISFYDIAVDIPINRKYAFLNRVNKTNYSMLVSESVTEYLGQRSHSGHIKLYDKGAELKLPIDMTRLEVTCDSFDLDTINDCLGRCYFLGIPSLLDNLSETDLVILELLYLSGCPSKYLNRLSRKKREVLEAYLSNIQLVQLDLKTIHRIREILSPYSFNHCKYIPKEWGVRYES